MQAGKRYSLWQTLNWSKKYIFIFLIINSIPVVLYEVAGLKWFAIPWQPISLVGIAVAFYIGFKNNSSYERLWEARKIWGGIVNSARSFTILSRDYITNEFATEKVSENELHKTHKTIVHRHVAWLKALTYQLRQIKAWEHNTKSDNNLRRAGGIHPDDNDMSDLQDYLSNEEYEYVMQKGNVASHIISLQSKHLKKLRHKGLMDDFRHMELGKLLTEFYNLQGKSERIKNFPFPRQYASLNAYFVMIFILLLPFSMLDVFGGGVHDYFIWLSIPFTTLISWVFHTMEMVGEYSENPFEGLYNDVPITSMARGIEIDIRQMIDETDLPETIEPFGEMKILI
jgi:putative membrane protein